MPFRYRLQKVLDFRINQKEEQRMKVQKAQQAVYQAEQDIKKNDQDILDTKAGSFSHVAGYCYELGAILVKHYRYSIPTNNAKINPICFAS